MAMPSNATFPDKVTFKFVVTVCDVNLFNYTAFTLQSQEIYEIYSSAEEKIYRYKKNIPLLSGTLWNIRADDKTTFLSENFLERNQLDDDYRLESLFIEDGNLKQFVSDQPDAVPQQIAQKDQFPIFVH